MTAAVFVDTNVLVYARDVRDASRQTKARAWLAHLWRTDSGRVSAQVLSEYYATITRKLKPGLSKEEAWDDVMLLVSWRPQPVDVRLLTKAHEVNHRYRLSWWDSLIVAAAQLQDCAVLLSEDLQDGAELGGVTIRNPFKLPVEEAQASYGLATVPLIRHRKPGRPQRMGA